jgi:D-hydroxyproline dehydrogenase subunit gamma
MFKRIEGLSGDGSVSIEVNGEPLRVRAGVTLALALLERGFLALRHSVVRREPRAPLCLMGACFECLVEIDGRDNAQACMVAVRDGMRVQLRSNGKSHLRV